MSNSTPLPDAPTDPTRLRFCQFLGESIQAWSDDGISLALKDQPPAIQNVMMELFNLHLRAVSVIMHADTGDERFMDAVRAADGSAGAETVQ